MLLQERCAYQGICKLDLDIKKERTEKKYQLRCSSQGGRRSKAGQHDVHGTAGTHSQGIARAALYLLQRGVLLSAVPPESQLALRYSLAAAGAVGHAEDGAARPERQRRRRRVAPERMRRTAPRRPGARPRRAACHAPPYRPLAELAEVGAGLGKLGAAPPLRRVVAPVGEVEPADEAGDSEAPAFADDVDEDGLLVVAEGERPEV